MTPTTDVMLLAAVPWVRMGARIESLRGGVEATRTKHLSIDASYHIWYRFPFEWARDELFCSLFEAAVGGLAIAAIVRPAKAPGAPAA